MGRQMEVRGEAYLLLLPLAARLGFRYLFRMDGINDRIRKLRREVELALDQSGPLPPGVRLVADRVSLTLTQPASSAGELGSQITIEFQVHEPEFEKTRSAPPPDSIANESTSESLRETILETASAVFGPGGFDNSARAEVFCELVSGMEAADVVAALELVQTGATGPIPSALQYPASRLRQVLGFSPLGSEIAAARLREILKRSSVSEVVTIVGQDWRFGTHWPESGEQRTD